MSWYKAGPAGPFPPELRAMPKNPRYLDENAFKALLRACRQRNSRNATRDRMLFQLLGRTGLRISEALALTPQKIYLNADPPFLRVCTLKKRKPVTDEVYLDRPLVAALKRYIRSTLPGLLGSQVWPDSPLFPSRFRTVMVLPMTRRNALALFRYYARRAQLPAGVTLHSLRHFRGTYLYSRTRDLEFTREQLRHSDLKITQGYLHQSPEVLKGYLSRLSERRGKK